MSDQMIDTLKEWFEKEWLYERHLTASLIRDKEAFKKGCEYFDSKNYYFQGELLIQLRTEAGLAEVARTNKNLVKYATHCFRQVEKVLSEFILVNPGIEILAKYLLNNKNFITDQTPNWTLNISSSKNLSHTFYNENTFRKELNPKCLILKLNKIVLDKGQYKQLNNLKPQLSQKEENRIFKSIMYFKTFGAKDELTDNANIIPKELRPSLWAFDHMYHFRNISSHLNSKDNSLYEPKYKDDTEKYRIQRFYSDPMEVLKFENESPGFYQRYVDMVLFLYSEYSRKPSLSVT